MGRIAVFLDRDGTINVDGPYLSDPGRLTLLPCVPEGIRLLNESGLLVVVITNQSGVARGYFTEETLARIHKRLAEKLGSRQARYDALYFCPHHPDAGCKCRKPGTLLFEKAARELGIDLARSFVVGDGSMDVIAGKRLGLRAVLVQQGPQLAAMLAECKRQGHEPDYVASDMLDAARWIARTSSE